MIEIQIVVVVVTLFGVLVRRLVAKLWKTAYDNLPFPSLEPFLPPDSQGIAGTTGSTLNSRVKAYSCLPDSYVAFKERYFWDPILVFDDPKYFDFIDRLTKPPYILRASEAYAGSSAIAFSEGAQASRNHARLARALTGDPQFYQSLHVRVITQATKRFRTRCLDSQDEYGGFSAEEECLLLSVESFCAFAQLGVHPWLCLPFGGELLRWNFKEEINVVTSEIAAIVQTRISALGSVLEGEKDILDSLLETLDENEREIIEGTPVQEWLVDQMKGLILCAVLPVTRTLCWALYLLTLNSQLQERLRKELDDALQSNLDQPSWNALKELKYFDAFLNEVLRLYPAVPFIERAWNGEELPDVVENLSLPFGIRIRFDLFSCQRKNSTFLDWDNIDIDRWMKKDSDLKLFSFGLGRRCCLGQSIARDQLKVVLATLLQQNRLLPFDLNQGLPDGKITRGVLGCSPVFHVQILDRYS